jgi:iron complex outermembrane receptor protein
LDLPRGFEFDWTFRYVAEVPIETVPSYATSDVRLGWRPNPSLEFSVMGRNLHEPHHREFSSLGIERSVRGAMIWVW